MKAFLVWLTLLLIPAQLWAAYVIQGQIKGSKGVNPAGARVVLVEIIMDAEQPQLKPVKTMEADAQGRYRFELQDVNPFTFYRVGALAHGVNTGTDPVKFGQETTLTLDLELPEVAEGLAAVAFVRNTLFFELQDDFVRVSDVLVFENQTTNFIDGSNQPLIKELPPQAKNFKILDSSPDFNIQQEGQKLVYRLKVPQGKHQMAVSYDLPKEGRGLSFSNQFPPGTEELELVLFDARGTAHFEGEAFLADGAVMTGQKRDGNFIYRSKRLVLPKGRTAMGVELRGLGISQKRLVYPASLLLVLLMAGSFYFLKVKGQAPQKEA